MEGFDLDPRLAGDTLAVTRLESGLLRLMDDARWPWLILVPAVPGAAELHDLTPAMARLVHEETDRIGAALKRATGCTKINTGALGNVVRQLHIHIIARFEGDPNWPGPVWGFGERQAWRPGQAHELIRRVMSEMERLQAEAAQQAMRSM